jgi:CDP-diacylglycerol pyrophosphatase
VVTTNPTISLKEKALATRFFKTVTASTFVAVLTCFASQLTWALEKSDILLDIVSNCVDPSTVNYCSACRSPRNDAGCAAAPDCKRSTEIWALSAQYAVIRDIKMCGCPAEFVHGLAIPRVPVRGVEDPIRPDGIWKFAWDAAVQRMDPESIALVVNPQLHRSQNQLHVHLLRLRKGAKDELTNQSVHYMPDLDHVWAVAARAAQASGLDDYGVLVHQRAPNDFRVTVTAQSPEAAFTQERCN